MNLDKKLKDILTSAIVLHTLSFIVLFISYALSYRYADEDMIMGIFVWIINLASLILGGCYVKFKDINIIISALSICLISWVLGLFSLLVTSCAIYLIIPALISFIAVWSLYAAIIDITKKRARGYFVEDEEKTQLTFDILTKLNTLKNNDGLNKEEIEKLISSLGGSL